MGNCYNYTPIPPAEASCIIAHLFVELALPCSCCKREDGVIVIQGKTYDGSSARVTIKGEEVRYYGKQRTCLLYTSPSPRDCSSSRMPSSA